MYSQRLERAIRIMLQAHAGQLRKADPQVPYATHPFHVALMVREAGGDEDCVIAALLHDVLEDTDVTPEDLEESFGSRVAAIVREVSEDKTLSWEERKARMVDHLRNASPEACLVAAADKIHNLETLVDAHRRFGDVIWTAFRRGPGPTVRFHRQALDAIRGRIPERLETTFVRAVTSAEELAGRSV
jgi:(p)ppGpp synthase/HD superfamily hydrolase